MARDRVYSQQSPWFAVGASRPKQSIDRFLWRASWVLRLKNIWFAQKGSRRWIDFRSHLLATFEKPQLTRASDRGEPYCCWEWCSRLQLPAARIHLELLLEKAAGERASNRPWEWKLSSWGRCPLSISTHAPRVPSQWGIDLLRWAICQIWSSFVSQRWLLSLSSSN